MPVVTRVCFVHGDDAQSCVFRSNARTNGCFRLSQPFKLITARTELKSIRHRRLGRPAAIGEAGNATCRLARGEGEIRRARIEHLVDIDTLPGHSIPMG